MKEKKQKSCKYCKNYSIDYRYCYCIKMNILDSRKATHCNNYSEVPVGRKKKIIEYSKNKFFNEYRT